MKDNIVSKVSRAKSLSDIEKSLAEEGRISDETRRELVRKVARVKIPKKDLQAAYEMVMGSLSSVLNESRCMDWWETVSHSDVAVRAALNRKLPFKQSVIQEFSRAEIITKLLAKGEDHVAWVIWTEAMDDAGRKEMLIDMLQLFARENIKSDDRWMSDLLRIVSAQSIADRIDYMGRLFCDKFLRNNQMAGMDPAMRQAFPAGVSGDQASKFIAKLSELSGGVVPEMEEEARNLLQPLRSIANQQTLDAATPQANQPSPSRRI